MFFVECTPRSLAAGDGPGLVELLRPLRPEAAWSSHAGPGWRVALASGQGVRPAFARDPAGNWLLAAGTPSMPGAGIGEAGDTVGLWLETAIQAGRLGALTGARGLWVFALYRAETRELTVAVDRAGIVPVHAHVSAEGCSVASSALALGRRHSLVLSDDGLALLATVGYTVGDTTLVEGARRLGPGELLSCSASGCASRAWWMPPGPTWVGVERLAAEFVDVARASLADRLRTTDNQLGFTAGLDTRLIIALAQATHTPVHGFTGRSDEVFAAAETERARDLAVALGVAWDPLTDEPTDREHWRSLLLENVLLTDGVLAFSFFSSWARRLGGCVYVWGLGGESLRDFWSRHESARWLLQGRTSLDRLMRYRMVETLPRFLLVPERAAFLADRGRDLLARVARPWADRGPRGMLDLLYLRERMRCWGALHWNCVAWRTTPELPLLPQDAIDIVYRLGPEARREARFQKWAIAQLDERAARLPHNGGYATRPDAGLRGLVGDRLRDARKLARKLYDRHVRRRGFAVRALDLPTYGEAFADLLDAGALQTARLYDPSRLAAALKVGRTQRLASNGPLNAVVAIEWAVRQGGLRMR